MNWCGLDSEGLSLSLGRPPGSCVTYTFLLPLPALLFLSSSFNRWHVTSHYLPFSVLDAMTHVFLLVVQALHVMLVALLLGFMVLNDPTSGALLFFSLWQSVALLAAAGVTTREAWRLTEWPGSSVKLFLGATCVVNLVSTIGTRQHASSSSGSLWCGLAMTLLSAVLFLFGLYKETLRSPEEKERLELDRVSVDVHDGNLLNGRHDSTSTRESRLGFWNASGFFQLLPLSEGAYQPGGGATGLLGSVQATLQKGINFLVGDPIITAGEARRDVRDGRGLHAPLVDEDGSSDWGASPPFSRTFTNTSVQSSLTSASAGYDGAFVRSRSHDSAFSSSHQPVVRSALESHLGTSAGANQGGRLLGSTREWGKAADHGSGNSLSTLGGGAGEDRERVNSGASAEMGVALQRALDAQRARMGGYALDGASSPKKGRTSRDGNGNSSSLNRATAALTTEEEKVYSVTVARWGLRRDRIHDEAPAPEAEGSDRDKGGNDVEIEFELHVRRSLATAASEWSQSDQHSSSAGKRDHWTVWRTAAEVLQLHASLATAFGDVVPRRPRLRSALPAAAQSSAVTGEAAACSPSDIAADMRAIGIYLMALLRGQVYMEYPGVLSFLEIWDYCSNTNNIAQLAGGRVGNASMGLSLGAAGLGAGAGSSGGGSATVAMPNTQEKWRKLFVSLRVRVKPHEVGVRCRLFEGVVSGTEITAWLTASGYSHLDSCCIGQRLVECGLLVTVCSGYHAEDGSGDVNWASHPSSSHMLGLASGANDDDREECDSPQSHGSVSSSSLTSTQWNDLLQAVATGDRPSMSGFASQGRFSDIHGNLYTFQQKHATSFAVGKFVLFGTTITATISQWVRVSDEEEGVVGGVGGDARSQTSGGISMVSVHPDALDRDEGAPSAVSPVASGSGSAVGDKNSHVEYIIDCRHGGDEWALSRRYQAFAELHRAITARGIKPAVGLPPKTFTSLKSSLAPANAAQQRQQNDARRVSLEKYLTSVLESVVSSGAADAQAILAKFLDEDFDILNIL